MPCFFCFTVPLSFVVGVVGVVVEVVDDVTLVVGTPSVVGAAVGLHAVLLGQRRRVAQEEIRRETNTTRDEKMMMMMMMMMMMREVLVGVLFHSRAGLLVFSPAIVTFLMDVFSNLPTKERQKKRAKGKKRGAVIPRRKEEPKRETTNEERERKRNGA